MSRVTSVFKWVTGVVLLFFCATTLAAWPVTYNGGGDDRGVAVATDASGFIYALIAEADEDGDPGVVVNCYDAAGNQVVNSWRCDDDEVEEVPFHFAVSGTNPYTDVVIYVAAQVDENWELIAFDQSQTTCTWHHPFQYGGIPGDLADIAPQRCGTTWGVVATGTAEQDLTGLDWLTVSYDADGNVRWHHFFDGGNDEYNDDYARAVACNAEGDVFVTGSSASADVEDENYCVCTVKYPAAGPNPDPAWKVLYDEITLPNGESDEDDEGWDIVADAYSYVYVAAKYLNVHEDDPASEDTGTVVLRYNQDPEPGTARTNRLDDDNFDEAPLGLAYYNNGQTDCGVFVVVSKSAVEWNARYTVTRRCQNSGNSLRTLRTEDFFLGPDANTDHSPRGLAATNNVYCYVTNNTKAEVSGGDIATLMYASDGATEKEWDVASAGLDQAAGVAAVYVPMGSWYVAMVGTTPGAEDADAIIDLYDVPQQWSWEDKVPMPLSGGQAVKDGGWLDYNSGNGLVYAAKGNKTYEFYAYSPGSNEWTQPYPNGLNLIPSGTEGKPPSKGCRGVCDGDNCVYMTKGNNTVGFWRYSVSDDTWVQLRDVPLGTKNKKVKGGTDMAYVHGDVDYVYLLKGYKNEFYRYKVSSDSWQSLPSPPAPITKYNNGSWLVSDGGSRLYAHQASYHTLYAYDVNSGTWGSILPGMPFVGRTGRIKKSKDGGSATWFAGAVFALKGGNSQEFWKYAPATDSWKELDTLPQVGSSGRKKRVKNGGDVTCADNSFYALKGNNTRELWRYKPDTTGEDGSAFYAQSRGQGGQADAGETGLSSGVAAFLPRWNAQGTAVCYSREADDGIGAGFEQIYMVRKSQPGVEIRLVDVAMDCSEPVFSPSGAFVCFVLDDTVSDRLQLAKVLVPLLGLAPGQSPVPAKLVAQDPSAAGQTTAQSSGCSSTAARTTLLGCRDNRLQLPSVDRKPVAPGNAVHSTLPDPCESPASLPMEAGPYSSGIITMLTSDGYDHYSPQYQPSGGLICYCKDDSTSRSQIYLISSQGGQEHALTSDDDADHDCPSFLNSSYITYCTVSNASLHLAILRRIWSAEAVHLNMCGF